MRSRDNYGRREKCILDVNAHAQWWRGGGVVLRACGVVHRYAHGRRNRRQARRLHTAMRRRRAASDFGNFPRATIPMTSRLSHGIIWYTAASDRPVACLAGRVPEPQCQADISDFVRLARTFGVLDLARKLATGRMFVSEDATNLEIAAARRKKKEEN